MTVRNKLILSSIGLVILILLIGVVSIWSLTQWQDAADLVALDRQRTSLVDRIRTAIGRQIDYGLIHLNGGPTELESFSQTEQALSDGILHLNELAKREEEDDHIQGFEETLFEVSYVVRGILETIDSASSPRQVANYHEKLLELSDEISDDVTVLDKYYRRQVDESVTKANHAGRTASLVIGLGLFVALTQTLAMIFISRRWLVRPIGEVGRATSKISRGDWDIRLDVSREDEWGELAQSVNDMAASLGRMRAELQTKERLAAVGEVAAYTAHNIRNPLAGIRAAAQVGLNDLRAEDEGPRETLTEIISAVDRMERWIKALMNFSAPVDLVRQECDLETLVTDVVKMLVEKARQGSVTLKVELHDTRFRIFVDPDLFAQALANIVINAIESGTDRVVMEVAKSDSSLSPDAARLAITDYGRGIDPEIEPKLFRTFTTNKSGGTGLGLAQAKKIIELHNGELSIKSNQGEGTTVTISIPLKAEMNTGDIGD